MIMTQYLIRWWNWDGAKRMYKPGVIYIEGVVKVSFYTFFNNIKNEGIQLI